MAYIYSSTCFFIKYIQTHFQSNFQTDLHFWMVLCGRSNPLIYGGRIPLKMVLCTMEVEPTYIWRSNPLFGGRTHLLWRWNLAFDLHLEVVLLHGRQIRQAPLWRQGPWTSVKRGVEACIFLNHLFPNFSNRNLHTSS